MYNVWYYSRGREVTGPARASRTENGRSVGGGVPPPGRCVNADNKRTCLSLHADMHHWCVLRVYGASGQDQALFLTKPRPDRVPLSLSLLGTLATPPQATGRPPLTSQPLSLSLSVSRIMRVRRRGCRPVPLLSGSYPPAVAKTGFFRYARGRCARNCRLGLRAQAITRQQAAASNRLVRYMQGCTSYRSILV